MKFGQKMINKEKNESLPVRGAWIEIFAFLSDFFIMLSLPVRGAWIEIHRAAYASCAALVAPRKGSVD